MILARFSEAPGPRKIVKNRKNSVRDAFGTHLGFDTEFGSDFKAIFRDFGWILRYFRRIWGNKK